MVHLNKKYIDHEQRALDHDYLANKDGIAVLGFLFNVSGTKVSIRYFNRISCTVTVFTSENILSENDFVFYTFCLGLRTIRGKNSKIHE